MYQELGFDIQSVMEIAVGSGLFVSLCTIKAPVATFGPSGAPAGGYANTAFVNIACMKAPDSIARIQGVERKSVANIEDYVISHILLDTYYPGIISGWVAGWIAVIDGETLDILGVERDSQKQMTRLLVRVVTL